MKSSKKKLLLWISALAVAGVLGVGCTLILPTDKIIKPCQLDGDCGPGFTCQQNACLPADTAEGEAAAQ